MARDKRTDPVDSGSAPEDEITRDPSEETPEPREAERTEDWWKNEGGSGEMR